MEHLVRNGHNVVRKLLLLANRSPAILQCPVRTKGENVSFDKLDVQCSHHLFSALLNRALYINMVGMVMLLSLACLCGIALFAVYSRCDPLKLGLIKESDQVIFENLESSVD